MRKIKASNTREGIVADETIYYCESCSKCWEKIKVGHTRSKKHGYLFYEDFPSYKKKRKTCIGCEGNTLVYKISKRGGIDFYDVVKS